MTNRLRIYTCKHTGVFIGGCSVVIAHDEDEAFQLLLPALIASGIREGKIDRNDITFTELPRKVGAHVLFNGDY